MRLITLLLCCLAYGICAQPVDHLWLENDVLRVRINADGRLFCDDTSGAFWVRQAQRPDAWVNVMRAAGLWLGGLDAGGNLLLSAQTYGPHQSDFVPGCRGLAKMPVTMWKVTKADIEAHLQDFRADSVVDNPLPSIYGWPGANNRFFGYYNGFNQPEDLFAPFLDPNWNGQYEPDLGEIPGPVFDRGFLFPIPHEMIFWVFHNDVPPALTTAPALPIQGSGEAFVFNCPESTLLYNSVFVAHRWNSAYEERVDTTVASLFVDADLGGADGDYHGMVDFNNTYFVYNANEPNTQWPNADQSVMLVRNVSAPFTYKDGDTTPSRLMPIGGDEAPPRIGMPVQDFEFYNYQTGTWRDGSPLTIGGNGYDGNSPAESAFPGMPGNESEWSEWSAHNPPGDRRGLINYYTGDNFKKGMINCALHAFTLWPSKQATIAEQLKAYQDEYEMLYSNFYCCIDPIVPPPGYSTSCTQLNLPALPTPELLQVYPNPATDLIRIWHAGACEAPRPAGQGGGHRAGRQAAYRYSASSSRSACGHLLGRNGE
ncbi:MAG TPA: hypothetical protein PKD78_08945 [Saprospiraceae bacterium]|nr:hypothetical protein [Saprospiraceae bacterium]HNG89093.1 hypothetical protein [Saprospiraceae bacterium]